MVREGKIKFVPERFTKVYENWMENVRDWCISRQLWWGHRIPAWYCDKCGKITVAKEAPAACPDCGGAVRQDEDVLDTWFSSGLWPFSTLGWPEDTADLEYFFPTDVLVTGYDIIFFWVARMIFMSLEFTGREPFHTVVIHGMVRDALGRKMSKSPATASTLSRLSISTERTRCAYRLQQARLWATTCGCTTRKLREPETSSIALERFRYCLYNLKALRYRRRFGQRVRRALDLSRLERTIEAVEDAMNRFEPGEAIGLITDFVWNEFCDWYIEISKEDLARPDLKAETQAVLWSVLRDSLALLHPFTPFVTEELWSYLPGRAPGKEGSLIAHPYPRPNRYPVDEEAEDKASSLIEATKAIRNMRAEVNIPTGKKARAIISADEPGKWESMLYIGRLAWAEPLDLSREKARRKSPSACQRCKRRRYLSTPSRCDRYRQGDFPLGNL